MYSNLKMLKSSAKKICRLVKNNGRDIQLSQCQEFVAKMAGFESYHFLYVAAAKEDFTLRGVTPNEAVFQQFISAFQLDISPETFADLVDPTEFSQPYVSALRGVAGDDWM